VPSRSLIYYMDRTPCVATFALRRVDVCI